MAHEQYLRHVAYMNSPHEDAFGNILLGHSVNDYAIIAKSCEIWEERARSVEAEVDKHITFAKMLCAPNVQLEIQGLEENVS